MKDNDDITSTVSLQRLAESKGIELRKRGALFHGRCPFHDSKSDTLVIDIKANTWSCTGRCRVKNGGVIAWVMKSEGVSKKHAVELIRSDFTAAPDAKPSKAKRANTNKIPAFVSGAEPDAVVLGRVVDYYHATLKQNAEALAYLTERGLQHGGMIDTFKIGLANRSIGYRLPATNRRAGFELRGQLIRIGIYRKSGHEHFAGSIVVPWTAEGGHVENIYGRKITKRLRAGTSLHTWLHDKPVGVFNIRAVKASREVVVADSVINALTFWCHDLPNVTVAVNPQHFTDTLLPAFKAHGTERVYLAGRRTKEGEQQAEAFGAHLAAQGIEVFCVVLPQGKDANDLAGQVKDPRDALHQAVRNATWLAGASRTPNLPPPISEERDPEEPASIHAPPEPEAREDEVVLHYGDRRWRVRGLAKNQSFEVMRVNLLVSRENGHPQSHGFHVDTLELYSSRQRQAFIKQASDELGLDEATLKNDMGRVLLELETRQDKMIRAELTPKAQTPEMSFEQREAALALLRDPKLTDRILADFERAGFIGENVNKLTAYVAVTSRKLEEPLAIVVQSSSAAGKSSLMDAVLSFLPEEDRTAFSAMTGQSLYYMGEHDLAHRVLAIAEEGGAKKSSYALKLLQSEGEISIASTAKDPGTGRLITQEYRVQGPVMLFLTTTSIEIDPELANRCIVLTVDEGREQTAAIHAVQRRRQTLEGLLEGHDHEAVVSLHRNAQRLLAPMKIVNPFAAELAFYDGQTRSRRDHQKYLNLIKTVTLLHQHQRAVRSVEHRGHRIEYIEVERSDIEIADKLAAEVLSPLADELPPQTAQLLEAIKNLVQQQATAQDIEPSKIRFTRRQLRERLGVGNTTVRLHLARLVDLEYVIHERGRRRVSTYGYDADLAGQEATWRGLGTPVPRQVERSDSGGLSSLGGVAENARLGTDSNSASYTNPRP